MSKIINQISYTYIHDECFYTCFLNKLELDMPIALKQLTLLSSLTLYKTITKTWIKNNDATGGMRIVMHYLVLQSECIYNVHRVLLINTICTENACFISPTWQSRFLDGSFLTSVRKTHGIFCCTEPSRRIIAADNRLYYGGCCFTNWIWTDELNTFSDQTFPRAQCYFVQISSHSVVCYVKMIFVVIYWNGGWTVMCYFSKMLLLLYSYFKL